MVEVKIFVVQDHYNSYDDYDTVISEGISDWEEVTEEEYKLLNQNLWRLKEDTNRDLDGKYLLIRKDKVPINNRIDSIKKALEKIRLEEEKKARDAEIKKAKRIETKIKNQKEKDLALLKTIQERYPEAFN